MILGLAQLSQRDQALFGEIEPAPQIISFRNKLTHEYITINNQLVWGVSKKNLPALVDQCRGSGRLAFADYLFGP